MASKKEDNAVLVNQSLPVSPVVMAVIDDASEASELPVNAALINVALNCSESGSPCITGSTCLEGDMGVYCQCYERYFSKAEVRENICLACTVGKSVYTPFAGHGTPVIKRLGI